jgi:hypothetical protein
MKGLFRKGCGTVFALLALTVAAPAVASASTPVSCPDYPLSQPFLAWGDFNQYTLLGGQSFDNFDGAGWQLTGGAKLVTTTLADGHTGQVLDLPSGGQAVSPTMCVNSSSYPLARAMAADLAGTQGVQVYIQYSNGYWGTPLPAGIIKNTYSGFNASKPIMLHSPTLIGVHLARFTLVGASNFSGSKGEYQVYNFFVDPRMSH